MYHIMVSWLNGRASDYDYLRCDQEVPGSTPGEIDLLLATVNAHSVLK